MSEFLFHIIILAVAAFAVVRGFRMRLSQQVPSLIAFALGGVCSHIFMEPATDIAISVCHIPADGIRGYFLASNIAGAVVFGATYSVFRFCTGIVGLLLRSYEGDILDSIAGSFFCMVKYLMALSIAYNLALGISLRRDSSLLKYADQDDANVVREVMLISPGVLGSESVSDLSHRIQLDDARRIS